MTFLNSILLFGAAAAAIPIIIHILNRRRARVVDWGAMMFLAESVASRNRVRNASYTPSRMMTRLQLLHFCPA